MNIVFGGANPFWKVQSIKLRIFFGFYLVACLVLSHAFIAGLMSQIAIPGQGRMFLTVSDVLDSGLPISAQNYSFHLLEHVGYILENAKAVANFDNEWSALADYKGVFVGNGLAFQGYVSIRAETSGQVLTSYNTIQEKVLHILLCLETTIPTTSSPNP